MKPEVGTLPAAVAEAKELLSRLAKTRGITASYKELEKIAEKHNVPYHTLVREAVTGFKLIPLDGTFMVEYAGSSNPGIILAPEEAAIPEFGEKFERCVLHLKPAEEKGQIHSAYAVCRAHLRRKYGLPLKSKT